MIDMWMYAGMGGSAGMAAPCPADLVPHDRLLDVAASVRGEIQRRDIVQTRALLATAAAVKSKAAQQDILQPFSIVMEASQSPFVIGTAGAHFDIHTHHGVDVLHQLLEGVFPVVFTAVVELMKQHGGTAAVKLFDSRFMEAPTHPTLQSLGSDGAVERPKYTGDAYYTIMVV